MKTIFTNPQWVNTWVDRRTDWSGSGYRFSVLAASRSYPDEDLYHCLGAMTRMREAGATCFPTHGHFGQKKYRDWFDADFWKLPAMQLHAMREVGYPRDTLGIKKVAVDFEPYGLHGHRYPTNLYEDHWSLSEAMSAYLEQLRLFDVVYVEQAHTGLISTKLLKLNGVNVVALPNTVKSWPYGGEDLTGRWAEQVSDWDGLEIPAEPVVYAATLRDTPDMRSVRDALDISGDWWVFFAGNDMNTPGLKPGITRENCWRFGLDDWEDAWESKGERT